MEDTSMFWGVILKPEKRYEQTVFETFHVSKACLEPSTAEGGKVTSVYLEKDADEFIICNLKAPNGLNEDLDLNFNSGEKICFRVEGTGTVHLTGYLMEQDDDEDFDAEEDDSMMMGDTLMEEDSDEEEEVPPALTMKKRKLGAVDNCSPANGQEKKKKKLEKSALDKLVEEAKKSGQVKKANSAKKALSSPADKKKPAVQDDGDEMEEDEEDSDEDDHGEEEEDSDADEEEMVDDDSEEDEGEEEEEEEQEEQPASKKKAKTPPSSKKDKTKGKVQNGTHTPKTNGTPVPKKPALSTPKDKVKAADTPKSQKKNNEKNKANSTNKEGQKTPKRTLKGGLMVEDLKVGTGQEAAAGKYIEMYYEGKFKDGGKSFDSCKQGEKPFKFKLGQGEVVKGWDLGIAGMKVGGKRRLTVPPKLAYGSEGVKPDIPPNATLVFDVECKSVS